MQQIYLTYAYMKIIKVTTIVISAIYVQFILHNCSSMLNK